MGDDVVSRVHAKVVEAWMAYYGVNTPEEAIAAKKDDPDGVKRQWERLGLNNPDPEPIVPAPNPWRVLMDAAKAAGARSVATGKPVVTPPQVPAPRVTKPKPLKLSEGCCLKCWAIIPPDHPWSVCEDCMTDDQLIQAGLKKGVIIDDLAAPEVKNDRGVNKAAYQRILDKKKAREDRAQE